MNDFKRILYVSHGSGDDLEALKQGLSLARNNNAFLSIVIATPSLPQSMDGYKDAYERSLCEHFQETLQRALEALHLDAGHELVIAVESSPTPSVAVIQRVLREKYDLVIKAAIPCEEGKGFAAFDMNLLRKCPCPVWLCRPIEHSRDQITLGVAIDPDATRPVNVELSKRLLMLSRNLADTCSGVLKVIACWDHHYEGFLLHNRWAGVKPDEVEGLIQAEMNRHANSLQTIITDSGIGGDIEIHHKRGSPDTMIPRIVESERVDILVMGTVARTGIPGFFIGNTAENVLQKLSCSLVALKPDSFYSPVTA